ncbi:MAG TPA: Uma2 family endonuclease [Pyrinomonadaceae bacterium]|jgi:Uma2 family endonuclease
MESVLTLKEMALAAVNQKLILQGVGWDFYEEILKEFEDSNALHFAYDNGFLEVEVPTLKHEKPKGLLADLVKFICLELQIDYVDAGQTTFRKKSKAKGVEPDTGFYIQNESKVRELLEIDLQKDPPPDLVIEVDVTSPSLDKMPIYAALGVAEVWLYKGERVEFYKLESEDYREIENSIALPILSSAKATEFLKAGLSESSSKWFQMVRDWAKKAESKNV